MNANLLKHISDQQLLDNFYTDHNNNWIGILLERYTLLLFGVSMKYLKNEEEAKDAVQQIFYKVIVEIEKYKVTYFKSWIYMIAKNHCLMIMRKRQDNVPIDVTEKTLSADTNVYEHVYFEDELSVDAIHEALQELKKEQKQCITLFFLEKRSYHEIADRTGFTLMQVKSHIQNGKRNLKGILEKKLKHE
ncbi:MAG TPA: sigma-70 family RNA polymerase sigma factor [Puia sp.]|nr:sigma-70 family RNA polymerase sigma factor [Puia sp.]